MNTHQEGIWKAVSLKLLPGGGNNPFPVNETAWKAMAIGFAATLPAFLETIPVEFPASTPYRPAVRWPRLTVLIILAFAALVNAQSDRIVKVLPHFLDAKGRSSINPSLFDRDAYQKQLRENPAQRSALRFDVQWKASYYPELILRVEAKGARGLGTLITLEQTIKPGLMSQWTALKLSGKEYESFGELISWRATLVQGTNIVAEQKSFLW